MKSDAELCAAWRCGDSEALGELYRRYESDLHEMARVFSRKAPAAWNKDDAFEACILGLIAAANKHERMTGGSFGSFLHGCARNQARHDAAEWTRRYQSPTGYDSALAELLLDPASVERLDVYEEDEAKAESRRLRLEAALLAIDLLPEQQRIIVTEFYLGRVTMREIGRRFGHTEGWAYSKRKTALRRIRAIVGGEPEPRQGWGFTPKRRAPKAPGPKRAVRARTVPRQDSAWRREWLASEAARKRGVEVLPAREVSI